MQLTAPRSVSPARVAITFNPQPHALLGSPSKFSASLVRFASAHALAPHCLPTMGAVDDDAFTPVKSTLSGLPVHVAPLDSLSAPKAHPLGSTHLCRSLPSGSIPAGSIDSVAAHSFTCQAFRLPGGFPARRVLVSR